MKSLTKKYNHLIVHCGRITKSRNINAEFETVNKIGWIPSKHFGSVISTNSILALDCQKYFNGPKLMRGK